MNLLKKSADDVHPRVRLEAVRAASFFPTPLALDVALAGLDRPDDPFIDFVRGETLRTLEPIARRAIASGADVAFRSPAAARFFLKNVSTADLLKMKRTANVSRELLFRTGVRDEDRRAALESVARQMKQEPLTVLIATLRNEEGAIASQESAQFDLVRLLTGSTQRTWQPRGQCSSN